MKSKYIFWANFPKDILQTKVLIFVTKTYINKSVKKKFYFYPKQKDQKSHNKFGFENVNMYKMLNIYTQMPIIDILLPKHD